MEIEILSAQFDLQEANRYSLWLTLGDSECAFAVLNDVTKTFIWVKRVKQTSFTKTIALFNELSAIPFAQVVVELDLQPSILVPSVLYQYSHKRDFRTVVGTRCDGTCTSVSFACQFVCDSTFN